MLICPKAVPLKNIKTIEQVDKAAKIEVAQVDLDWEHKGELFVARWAHEILGHLGEMQLHDVPLE